MKPDRLLKWFLYGYLGLVVLCGFVDFPLHDNYLTPRFLIHGLFAFFQTPFLANFYRPI